MRAILMDGDFHCHSCSRSWFDRYWQLDADAYLLHDFKSDECFRCTMTHGTPQRCRFHKPTCTCDHPHVEITTHGPSGNRSISDSMRGIKTVQVRESQRAVVYVMPDGSIENPMTNSFDDPGAVDCSKRGGVRMDFPHLSDLQRLNRDKMDEFDRNYERMMHDLHQKEKSGELVPDYSDAIRRREWAFRNTIIDWDHQTISGGQAMTPAKLRTLEEMRPPKRTKGVYLDGGKRYEEAKRRSKG